MIDWIFYILIPLALGLWAQMRVSSTYNKYSEIPSRSGIRGREAAEYVMRRSGITDVEIVPTTGLLSDHYNPISKQLVLSEKNYYGSSLAALGVAAHEAGHAIQHAVDYKALKFRMALVPITSFASQLLPFVVFGGLLFGISGLIQLGVIVYLILTVFQLVTLPVEFDASKRAAAELSTLGIVGRDELGGVTKTLNAAAWTYIAAFVASLGNLIYLYSLARGEE